jgi:uncharacterized membrane protein YfcA
MNPQRTATPRPSRNEDPQQLAARARAADRRRAMRGRISRIRRTVAGLAVGLFSAAFLVVYVQLASGNDPALTAVANKQAISAATGTSGQTTKTAGQATAQTGTVSSTSSSAVETSSGSQSGSGESSTGSSAGSAESSKTSSAVTTSQS